MNKVGDIEFRPIEGERYYDDPLSNQLLLGYQEVAQEFLSVDDPTAVSLNSRRS